MLAFFLLRPDRSGRTQKTIEDASYMVASTLVNQWLYCNIYTIGLRHVKKRILKLYGEFKQYKLLQAKIISKAREKV